jgi:hypothetical protein
VTQGGLQWIASPLQAFRFFGLREVLLLPCISYNPESCHTRPYAVLQTDNRGTIPMADSALQNAEKRRDDLADQINKMQAAVDELRREKAKVEGFIADWHKFAGTQPDTETEAEIPYITPIRDDIPLPAKRERPQNNSKKEDVAKEVRAIVEAWGRPVLRKELLPELLIRGYVIEGTDPDMVLSTMLWRAGEAAGVVRLGKGGYWLREVDYPEARYFAETATRLDNLLNQDVGLGAVLAAEELVSEYLADKDPDELLKMRSSLDYDHPSSLNEALVEFAEQKYGRRLTTHDRELLGPEFRRELTSKMQEIGR